jgi:hypothetical protein
MDVVPRMASRPRSHVFDLVGTVIVHQLLMVTALATSGTANKDVNPCRA